jgi:regulator of nucleoside diphosphate kinase
MAKRRIYVTVNDMTRLGHLILSSISEAPDPDALHALEEELDRASPVRAADIPADVITMNSKVRLTDLDRGESREVTLVYPEQANQPDRVSILSALGTALLGYRVGDEIDWPTAEGRLRLRVEELLYQPEAAGRYHE